MMKESPILFNGAMVTAILAGHKTQTRRIVKLTDTGRVKAVGSKKNWHLDDPLAVLACPYGAVGDLLWVKENHRLLDCECKETCRVPGNVWYDADCSGYDGCAYCRLRPSIFMPRWASRITLEITGIRVERLNAISNEDCWDEGMSDDSNPERKCNRRWYSDLWESINGAGSWDLNPRVWVIEFKRVQQRRAA